MKKRTLTLMLIAFAMVMAACGGQNGNTKSESGAGAAESGLLGEIKANGKIHIGTEGTYPPFTYHDDSGKLTGFDVEIAEEIAKRLGVTAEFSEAKWDGMFAGLDAKRFDIVVNQVSINDERKKKYDFSDPYSVSKAVLIVHEDNQDVKAFADLKGKKAGQSLTSNLTELAKANGAEIVQTDGFNQAIELLVSKRIDATVNDGLSFLDFKKHRPEAKVKVVAEHESASSSGILLRKGEQTLVDAINKALADMKSDGTYLTISKKYFNADISK
ncbi:amino acid ABC transporter substrate-binding protein [Paenibacillus sp. ACRRX]|uniref:amino acid ABC transporter substrate-binding protein n=1 Tax=unclassified Paenibacillus TaxID=185978 RepID=UPI001EF48375|nr:MULTISPECIES: amino acid ABC transporter substrate-binding protein [unclassified Paenibacillus]MCG7405877.1 amino acid ABC transporter substrate-binding protein [Paenibacillus sp. ACRRX]MDK8182325.1 amino acid ABC transporter substrate-binding protein [Paenibacillus sp. UMB4589-SE434]